jgi:hypothetical protein
MFQLELLNYLYEAIQNNQAADFESRKGELLTTEVCSLHKVILSQIGLADSKR